LFAIIVNFFHSILDFFVKILNFFQLIQFLYYHYYVYLKINLSIVGYFHFILIFRHSIIIFLHSINQSFMNQINIEIHYLSKYLNFFIIIQIVISIDYLFIFISNLLFLLVLFIILIIQINFILVVQFHLIQLSSFISLINRIIFYLIIISFPGWLILIP
jgi:hypothetical protein